MKEEEGPELTRTRPELLVEGLWLPESPRWFKDRLYISDLYAGRSMSVQEDGSITTVCALSSGCSGLGMLPDGDLLVVSMRDQRIVRIAADGELSTYADLSTAVESACNDMLVTADGAAYVGNFGCTLGPGEPVLPTNLHLVGVDGKIREVANDLVFPNGMALTPDRTMVLAETYAYRLTAFDVDDDGSLQNRRPWAVFNDRPARTFEDILAIDAVAPDGIAMDAERAVWVADPTGSGAGRVLEGGEIVQRIDLGEVTPYAVGFGGQDGQTLYMCAAPRVGSENYRREGFGQVWKARVDVPGMAWG